MSSATEIWWAFKMLDSLYYSCCLHITPVSQDPHSHPPFSSFTSFSLMASFVSWHLCCSFFIYLSTSVSSTKWLTFFLYIWFDLSPKEKKKRNQSFKLIKSTLIGWNFVYLGSPIGWDGKPWYSQPCCLGSTRHVGSWRQYIDAT